MRTRQGLDGRRSLVMADGMAVRISDIAAMAGLLVLVFAAALLSLFVGATAILPSDAWRLFWGDVGNTDAAFVIIQVRAPRILMAIMVGWCVAMTGAMLQSLSQNPLADPGLLGLSQGAIVMVMVLLIFLPAASPFLQPFAALLGALIIGVVLMALVGRSHAVGTAILLLGIAIETVLSSIASILILYTPPETSYVLSEWLAGSLFRSNWTTLAAFFPWFLFSFAALILGGRALRSYDLGEWMAMALGEGIGWSKPAILGVAILLTAATVTAVGPLAFLGVIAPHLANMVQPSTGRIRLVLSGLMGSLMVILADILTRALAGSVPLPTGLGMIMIGAPIFVIALRLRALKTLS